MAKKKKKNVKKKQPQKQSQKQPSNVPAIVFFSISAVVIVAVLVFMMIGNDPTTESVSSYDFTYDGQPFIGDENAPIKIVEFFDYKCPACKHFAEEVLPQLKEDFIDKGDVQLFYMNFPILGDDSYTAAEVGEAIYAQEREAFQTYYETLFAEQQDESKRWATKNFLMKFVEDHLPEIDLAQLEKDLEENTYAQAVEEDQIVGENAGVSATPTLFINGKEFRNWSDYEAIKEEINRLLEQ